MHSTVQGPLKEMVLNTNKYENNSDDDIVNILKFKTLLAPRVLDKGVGTVYYNQPIKCYQCTSLII